MTGLRKKVLNGERTLGAMMFEFFSPGVAQVMKVANLLGEAIARIHSNSSVSSLFV